MLEMPFGQKLIAIFFVLLQLATFAFTKENKTSTEARVEALEQEMQSMRELMLEMQQELGQFSSESNILMRNVYATLTQANAEMEGKFQNMSRVQLELNTRIENISQRMPLRRIISLYNDSTFPEHMLENPTAKLYKYDGAIPEIYDFKNPTYKGGCYNLKTYYHETKMVLCGSKCVRAFQHVGCYGWSQAFYPGKSTVVDSKLTGIGSVGPCVDNEFDFVTTENVSGPVVKVTNVTSTSALYKIVPVLMSDAYIRSGFDHISSNSTPITASLFNWHRNRIEALAGCVYSHHIRTPSQAESNRVSGERQSFYNYLAINNSTDEVGFAFPLELAGPADQVYNVFPHDRIQAEKYRRTIVPSIQQFLEQNTEGKVVLGLNFFYENSASLRPIGIWYTMDYYTSKSGNIKEIYYGYFPNY